MPEAEHEETVNKAAALGRAIDLAEQAFLPPAAPEQPHDKMDECWNFWGVQKPEPR